MLDLTALTTVGGDLSIVDLDDTTMWSPDAMTALAYQGIPMPRGCGEGAAAVFVDDPAFLFQIHANAAVGGGVRYLGVQDLNGGRWARLSIRPPNGNFVQWSVRVAHTAEGLRVVDVHSLINGDVYSANWRDGVLRACVAPEGDTTAAAVQALSGDIVKAKSEGTLGDAVRVYLAGSEVARKAKINHNLAAVLAVLAEDSPEMHGVIHDYIARYPDDRFTPVLRCWSALLAERYAEASRCWEALAAAEGDDPQLLVFAAAQAGNAGDEARMTHLLDAALKQEPELVLGKDLRAQGY